jgi:hypothetical protein
MMLQASGMLKEQKQTLEQKTFTYIGRWKYVLIKH